MSIKKITDSNIEIADVTTNNVSTSKHGFAPKGNGSVTSYLNGNGAYSTPRGGGIVSPSSTLKAGSIIGIYRNTDVLYCTTSEPHGLSNGTQVTIQAENPDFVIQTPASVTVSSTTEFSIPIASVGSDTLAVTEFGIWSDYSASYITGDLWVDTSSSLSYLWFWNGSAWTKTNNIYYPGLNKIDGSLIADDSLLGNHLMEKTITTNKLADNVGSDLDISLNNTVSILGGALSDYQTFITNQDYIPTLDASGLILTIIAEQFNIDPGFLLLNNYLRIDANNNLVIGTVDSQLILKMETTDPPRIGFYQNDILIGEFANNQLKSLSSIEINNSLKIGNFAFAVRSNGNLGFGKA
jgi:hypothetical protein